jgi:sugar (pentulose or hexulose) kinase
MDAFVGVDVGTSAIKGIAISATGSVLSSSRRPAALLRPAAGLVEFEPESRREDVCDLLAELCAKIGAGYRVAGIAVSGASGSVLLLDRETAPIGRCVSWMDQRAAGAADRLLPGLDRDGVHDVVGWPWRDAFPAAQLAWARAMRPEEFDRAARFCLDTDYLTHHLTGEWQLDCSSATTFFLQDQRRREWHRPYLDMLGIPVDSLSRLARPGCRIGAILPRMAERIGCPASTAVVHGSFDHPSAARATGILGPGELLLSAGTSWVGFSPMESREAGIRLGLLVDPFLSPAGPWGVMASVSRLGVGIDRCVRSYVGGGEVDLVRRFNELSARGEPGAGGLLVNPVLAIDAERPLPALPSTVETASVARAIMEGAAFELRKKLAGGLHTVARTSRIVMVGGPSESPVWPGIIAAVMGCDVELERGQAATALGAALLAGIGTGCFADEAEAAKIARAPSGTVHPAPADCRRYELAYQAYRERFG